MPDTHEVRGFMEERDAILSSLDVDRARIILGPVASDEAVLIAMHKARYERLTIDPRLRHASGRWLRERGYRRYGGGELLPEGELPSDDAATLHATTRTEE